MNKFCVILPVRTGQPAKVLGNRVFKCRLLENNKVEILDDNVDKVVRTIDNNQCKIVERTDFKGTPCGMMWLK